MGGGESFLHLQTPGVHFADAGNFGEANHLTVGNVGDMGATQNRQDVMLTGAKQVDVADQHHFFSVFVGDSAVEQLIQGLVIARGEKLQGFDDPIGGINQPSRVGHLSPGQQRDSATGQTIGELLVQLQRVQLTTNENELILGCRGPGFGGNAAPLAAELKDVGSTRNPVPDT